MVHAAVMSAGACVGGLVVVGDGLAKLEVVGAAVGGGAPGEEGSDGLEGGGLVAVSIRGRIRDDGRGALSCVGALVVSAPSPKSGLSAARSWSSGAEAMESKLSGRNTNPGRG